MDLRCNGFGPCLVELDCGDDGAPMVDHLRRPVQSFEVLRLDKAAKGSTKLFSATEQLIYFLKHGLTLQWLWSMFSGIELRR
jgi:hypothetical protein